jgi:hypothetical protein
MRFLRVWFAFTMKKFNRYYYQETSGNSITFQIAFGLHLVKLRILAV